MLFSYFESNSFNTKRDIKTKFSKKGGGKFSFFHIGVFSELLKNKLYPKIISGTSGGSVMAAFLSVRTDEELVEYDKLKRQLVGDMWKTDLSSLMTSGHLIDIDKFRRKIQSICLGDITFMDAYRFCFCFKLVSSEVNIL